MTQPATTLARLVADALAAKGMSTREFERQADKAGYKVSYSTVGKITRGQQSTVTEHTAQALAHVLGIPLEDIYEVTGQELDQTEPALVALHRKLSPRERTMALKVFRAYVNSLETLRGADEDERPADGTTDGT